MALFKAESYKKGIFTSSVFNVASRSIAFVQQWLIMYYFGSNAVTDIYFFVYNITLYVCFFFLNMTTSALVPECIKLRNNVSNGSSMAFMNAFFYMYGAVGLAIVGLMSIDTSWIMGEISSLPQDVIEENMSLIRWCIPLIFLNLLIQLLTETMASYKYFTIPNMVTAINALLGVIFFILLHDELGLPAIVMGLILGCVFNLVVVMYLMKKHLGWDFLNVSFVNVKSVLGPGLYSQLGYVVYTIALFLPQYFFSQFSEGSLTAMNYADKLVSIPGVFLILQLTNVMAIKYNNLVSLNDAKGVYDITRKLIFYVPTALLVVSMLIGLSSGWIVNFLFGMGKFTADALTLTEDLLLLMVMILPFSFVYEILIRMLNAYKKQNIVLIMHIANYGVMLILFFCFMPKYGALSFPILRIIPFMIVPFVVLPVIKKYCHEVKIAKLSIVLLGITVVTVVFMALSMKYGIN